MNSRKVLPSKADIFRQDRRHLDEMMKSPPFNYYLHGDDPMSLGGTQIDCDQFLIAYPIIGPDKLDKESPVGLFVTSERILSLPGRLIVDDIEFADGVSKEARCALVAGLVLAAFKMGHEKLTLRKVAPANYMAWHEMGFCPSKSSLASSDDSKTPIAPTDMSLALGDVPSCSKAEQKILKPFGYRLTA